MWSSGKVRTSTRGLLLGVDINQRTRVMESLLSLDFDGKYAQVKFHPFLKLNHLPKAIVYQLLQSHNNFLSNTRNMTMRGTQNIHFTLHLKNRGVTTLSNLMLYNLVNRDTYIISTADYDGELTLIYDQKHEQQMKEWTTTMRTTIRGIIDKESTIKVFEDGNTKRLQPRWLDVICFGRWCGFGLLSLVAF